MSKINYYITPDCLTFYKDGLIKHVNSNQPYLFEALKMSLPRGVDYVEIDSRTMFKECLKNGSKAFGAADRLKSLQEANLPVEPLLSFIDKVPTEVLNSPDGYKLIHKVGTPDIPLTWDGNLILYQRSAWVGVNQTTAGSGRTWVDVESFTPFKVVTGTEERPLQAGGFDWVAKHCPDSGSVYEVIVQPQHILDVLSYGCWELSQVTQLSSLGNYVNCSQKAETGVVEFVTSCSDLGEKTAIRLPYNAGTAAKLLNAMFKNGVSSQALNNIVQLGVRSVVSC